MRFSPGLPDHLNVVRTVREPLNRLDPLRSHIDLWEIALYIMALAFTLEGASIRVLERDCL